MTGGELSFVQTLDSVAAVVPDRPAILWRDDVITFRELMHRADGVAATLQQLGIGRKERRQRHRWESGQDHVAIVMRDRPEWIEAMVGSFAAGAAPINVNYRYVAQELRQLFQLTRPAAVVYEAGFASQLDLVRADLGWSPAWIHVDDGSGTPVLQGSLGFDDARTGAVVPDRREPTMPDDLYILCTGGTTGLPKAVLWRQADVFVAAMGGRDPKSGDAITTIAQVEARIHPSLRPALPAVPLMHGAGQWNTLSTLFSGQPVVLSGVLDHLDSDAIWRNVERHRATSLIIAGNAFARPMVDALAAGRYDVSSLRVILSGAVALSSELKGELLELIPSATIVDAAGASESGTALIDRSKAGQALVSGTFEANPGTVILADDLRTTIEPGGEGVGWLARSGSVPLGYLDDQERTLQTFPEIDGERYAVPGDRARWLPGGQIELLGRDSMTINSGGEKIFAEEVETVIARHPAVYDVLVVGRPSERWGQEIVAVVQAREGEVMTLDSIRDEASRELARYKLPKDVVFVDQVRRSPAGKADYPWAQAVAARRQSPL